MEIWLNKSADLNKKVLFDFVYELPETLKNVTAHKVLDKLKVSGTYEFNEDETIVVSANIVVPMLWQCDRCGDTFEKNFFFSVYEKFSPTANEETYSYASSKLVLDQMIEEQFLLNLPSKILCREDCKGVCTKCGTNLNYGSCNCEMQVKQNNPFAGIKGKLN